MDKEILLYQIQKNDTGYNFYLDHKDYFSKIEQKSLDIYFQDKEFGKSSFVRFAFPFIFSIFINLILRYVSNMELLGIFSFLASNFFYYNFYSVLISAIINIILGFSMIKALIIYIIVPQKLGIPFLPKVHALILAIPLLILSFIPNTIIVYNCMKDMPTVRDHGYQSRICTAEEINILTYREVFEGTANGRTDQEDFGIDSGIDISTYDKYRLISESYESPFVINEYVLIRLKSENKFPPSAFAISLVQASDITALNYEFIKMSKFQFDNIDKRADDKDDTIVYYLENSKIILRIENL